MPDQEIQMLDPNSIDGVLMTWGDRLFYPGNRSVKARPEPKLAGRARPSAATIRERIHATVVRRAPQVMVKVTGGGRGMKAIAAYLRYISKNGRLTIEDEQGRKAHGRDALREMKTTGASAAAASPTPARNARPSTSCDAARVLGSGDLDSEVRGMEARRSRSNSDRWLQRQKTAAQYFASGLSGAPGKPAVFAAIR
jgi:hypothetical protein